MIQLFTDPLTDKIIGYNTIVPDNIDKKDIFLVDDNSLETVKLIMEKDLYFIDGKIVEDNKNTYAEIENKIKETRRKLQIATSDIENEHSIFMDNIINGMSLEEASKISKSNRNKVNELKKEAEDLQNEYEEEVYAKTDSIFEKEENRIEFKHFLSGLSIVRNEDDYIEEWLRYHIEELGFDHFYIYDNESETPVMDYLKKANFQHLDKITVIYWPTSDSSQEDSHNNFLEKYSMETKWVLPLDPDEYVVIKDSSKSLREFLEENSKYATIKCLWRHFNANGQVEKTSGNDMERFKIDVDWQEYKHGGKKFAQTNRISGFRNYMPIERHWTRKMDYDNMIAKNFFQLNHYFTRSWSEWKEKIKRGTSNPWYMKRLSMFFELNPDMKYLDTGEDYEQKYGKPDMDNKGNENCSEDGNDIIVSSKDA